MTVEAERLDALFRQAVGCIDGGDIGRLERMLADHPTLASERLESPGAWLRDRVGGALDGFFEKPWLLWFVAEDPERNGTLPPNIAEIATTIIRVAKRHDDGRLQEQLDYALRLVAWSGVARTCGVQIALIDALVDAGADPVGGADNAIVNGHLDAAAHLVERGAPLTLTTALFLSRWEDAERLAQTAGGRDKQAALVLAALNGKGEAVARAIAFGADPNANDSGIYEHASPLHHAAWSGSVEAVKALAEAGADLAAKDTANDATPLGWAEYAHKSQKDPERARRFAEVAAYLRERG
ncbi:MAG: ankyrin repeat domain-containing protein [Candidatus Poribacteria bacterium]|nr:ankyrin repeat domain-containing protein [Candidatus Poribacteria bacterium]